MATGVDEHGWHAVKVHLSGAAFYLDQGRFRKAAVKCLTMLHGKLLEISSGLFSIQFLPLVFDASGIYFVNSRVYEAGKRG